MGRLKISVSWTLHLTSLAEPTKKLVSSKGIALFSSALAAVAKSNFGAWSAGHSKVRKAFSDRRSLSFSYDDACHVNYSVLEETTKAILPYS